MLKFDYVEGDELPHRVQIDHLHGAGQTKSDAVVAALSVGNVIPPELGDDKGAIAAYLFWNYPGDHDWLELICVLEE